MKEFPKTVYKKDQELLEDWSKLQCKTIQSKEEESNDYVDHPSKIGKTKRTRKKKEEQIDLTEEG